MAEQDREPRPRDRRFGRVMREARIAKQLTQADLARRVDMSPVMISRVESGTRRTELENWVAIAAVLDLDLNQLKGLLDEEDPDADDPTEETACAATSAA